ncbi:hypothetical protein GW891_04250 [bacterium]|nr:hypothetical protein [bacterium]
MYSNFSLLVSINNTQIVSSIDILNSFFKISSISSSQIISFDVIKLVSSFIVVILSS